ncbi:hypothetical protein evm_014580 [Chilo suppressalis]|nr:hypothetical protein evm_014580 [Chilo suppressalis]
MHISGKENITADALSRVEVISIPPDFETIAQKHHNDPEVRELLENNSSSLKLQKVPVPDLCGIRLRHTTAYHREANGMVERFHRTLKAAIMAHETTRWTDVLPTVLLGVRTAWKSDMQCSVAEMVYGEPLRIPGY